MSESFLIFKNNLHYFSISWILKYKTEIKKLSTFILRYPFRLFFVFFKKSYYSLIITINGTKTYFYYFTKYFNNYIVELSIILYWPSVTEYEGKIL